MNTSRQLNTIRAGSCASGPFTLLDIAISGIDRCPLVYTELMEHSFVNIFKNHMQSRRLLWPAKMLLKYLKIKAAYAVNFPLCIPIFASVSVTQRCNLKCLICRFGDEAVPAPPANELTLKEFKLIFDALKKLGTEVIGITGGEPLLREDIFDIFAYIKLRGMGVHLSTNGSLLDERRIKLLLNSGVDWVNISLDGASAKNHNSLRGLHAFDGLLKNIARFLELRTACRGKTKLNLVMVINKANLSEAAEMVEFAKRLGVDGIGFMPFHPLSLSGGAVDRLRIVDIPAAEKTMRGLIALKKTEPIISNTGNYLKLFMGSFRRAPSPLNCYALLSTIAVDSCGNVYPCFPKLQMNREFSNIRAGSFRELLGSQEFKKASLEVKGCKDCYWNCHTELNLLFNCLPRALLDY